MCKVLVSLRIILNIVTEVMEEREHRHGYEMHIHGNLMLRYLLNDGIALLFGYVLYAEGIDVIRTFLVGCASRWCNRPRTVAERLVIRHEHALALSEKLVILTDLCQSDGSIDISHVYLHALSHDVVTPTTSLALCKRIFGLAVESHEAHLGIKLIIVKRRGHVKADGSTLGSGDVLYRVQREHGNVGLRTRAAAFIVGSDRMGRIAKHQYAS